jgi:acyl-[acyl carrier protein]--UDP-N-acetylglucosamine O-acyltransferase
MGGYAKVRKDCFVGGGAAIDQDVKVGDFAILRGNFATALQIPLNIIRTRESTIAGLDIKMLENLKVPQ